MSNTNNTTQPEWLEELIETIIERGERHQALMYSSATGKCTETETWYEFRNLSISWGVLHDEADRIECRLFFYEDQPTPIILEPAWPMPHE